MKRLIAFLVIFTLALPLTGCKKKTKTQEPASTNKTDGGSNTKKTDAGSKTKKTDTGSKTPAKTVKTKKTS